MSQLVEYFIGDYVKIDNPNSFIRYKGVAEIIGKSKDFPDTVIVEYMEGGEKVVINLSIEYIKLFMRGKKTFHKPPNYLLPPKPKKKKTDYPLWSDEVSSTSIRKLPRSSYIVPADPLPSKFISSKNFGRKGFSKRRGRY